MAASRSWMRGRRKLRTARPENATLAVLIGHPARLNLGDCFIYAQAKVGGASLLYKGEDFSKTDIESAS